MTTNRRPDRRIREDRILTHAELELRDEGEAMPVITGHPILYNVWSEDLGGFRERIMPGAASKTILEADIRALINHDPSLLLGRTTAGSLTLTEQAKGVHMRLTPSDTSYARDLITNMREGNIDQMSFAFRVSGPTFIKREDAKTPPAGTGEVWNEDWSEREIYQLAMYDASIVTYPAYPKTDAQVRSDESPRILPGLLTGIGIDLAELSAVLTRSIRELPLTTPDVDLLRGAVSYLQSHIPEPEPAEATTQDAPQAGRAALDHLRMLIELEAASA